MNQQENQDVPISTQMLCTDSKRTEIPCVGDLSPLESAGRPQCEAFIKAIYRKTYAADISVDYPVLISVRDGERRILAAAGYRLAATGPLFLEQYTVEPCEQILTRHFEQPVTRAQIAEVGNLASVGGGASLYLFAILTSCLERQGITHLMVTVTEELQRRFKRAGLETLTICDASAEKLSAEPSSWGNYYATRPVVLAVSLAQAIDRVDEARHARRGSTGQALPCLPMDLDA